MVVRRYIWSYSQGNVIAVTLYKGTAMCDLISITGGSRGGARGPLYF